MLSLVLMLETLDLQIPWKYARVVETKRGFGLVDGNLSRNFGDVAIEGTANIIVVAEDECLFEVESYSNDVTSIAFSEFISLLRFELMLEQEFLIIW